MKSIIFKLLKTVLPLLLGVYLVWYFFSNMDENGKHHFYKAIQEADYSWIILSIALSFIAFLLRAYRWKYMLEPMGYTPSFWNRYHAIMIGYIMNLTIPRAGEATRSAMLLKSDGIPFVKSFGTIIAERAVDFLMLLIVAGITAGIGFENFKLIFLKIQSQFGGKSSPTSNSNTSTYIIVSILIIFGAIGVLLFKKPTLRNKITGIIKGILEGVFSLLKCKNPIAYSLHTFLIWIIYIIYFGICFFALKSTSNFPVDGILLGFIAGSLGIVFTNGGIGTFPLLIGLVVELILGNKEPNALAIGNALGMIIWVSQTLVIIILGLISLLLIPKNFSSEHVEASTDN